MSITDESVMATSMVSVRRAYGGGQAIRSAPARRAAAEGQVATAGGRLRRPAELGAKGRAEPRCGDRLSFAVRRAKSATGGGGTDGGETRSASCRRSRGSPRQGQSNGLCRRQSIVSILLRFFACRRPALAATMFAMAFAILRFQKLKSLAVIDQAVAHLERTRTTLNADRAKTNTMADPASWRTDDPRGGRQPAARQTPQGRRRRHGGGAEASPDYFRPNDPTTARDDGTKNDLATGSTARMPGCKPSSAIG